MKPSEWVPGMTIIDDRGAKWTLTKRIAVKDGTEPAWDVAEETTHGSCLWDSCVSQFNRRPATYADLGRPPADGDRAVCVRSPGFQLAGTIWVFHGSRLCVPEASGYGIPSAWTTPPSDWLAPLSPLPPDEPARCSQCGALAVKFGFCEQHQWRAAIGAVVAPAPAECLRVADHRRRFERSWRDYFDGASWDEKWLRLPRMMAFATQLSIVPCGDCPACLARLSAEETRAQAEAQRATLASFSARWGT